MPDPRIIQLEKLIKEGCPECDTDGYRIEGNMAIPCKCLKQRQLYHSLLDSEIPPKHFHSTLENFQEIGDRYRMIKVSAGRFIKNFNPGCTGFLFTGKTGCGKTHIAASILKELIFKGYKGFFTNTVRLLLYIRSAQFNFKKFDELNDFMEKLTSQDILVMDDLGAEKTTEWTQERLYTIINTLYDNNKTIIVTSNSSLPEMADRLGERTVSRLCEMCFHDQNQFPGKDFRRAYLKHKL